MNLYTSRNEESDEDSHTEDSNISIDALFEEHQLGSGELNWRIQWFSNSKINLKKNNNKKNTNFIIIHKLRGNPSYLFIYFYFIFLIKNSNILV